MLGWLTAWTLWALPPDVPIHQLARNHWGQAQGLQGNAIFRLFQLPDGYLRIQTSAGLIRFDGARFVLSNPKPAGPDFGEPILATWASPDGAIFLRSATHTLKIKDGVAQALMAPGPLPDGTARAIFQDHRGRTWIGCDGQIYRIEGQQLSLLVGRADSIFDFLEDHQGRVWAVSSAGIYCFEEDKVRFFEGYRTPKPQPRLPMITIPARGEGPRFFLAIHEAPDGTLLVGTEKGLWEVRKDQLVAVAFAAPLKGIRISCILRDSDGCLWVGSDGSGLFRFASGHWSHFSQQEGLGDDSVLSLLEDREGSLWVGTRQGLDQFRRGPVRTLRTQDGLGSADVLLVEEDVDGAILAFTRGAGITRVAREGMSLLDTRQGSSENAAATLRRGAGEVWLGTSQGLNRIRDGKVSVFTGGKALLGNYITAIAQDERGLIFATNDRHLWCLNGEHLSPFEFPLVQIDSRPPMRYVWDIHRDGEGTIWFALSMGLYRLGRGEPVTKTQLTAYHGMANFIWDDGRGYLWVAGTETPGFSRLEKKTGALVSYTPAMGATVDAISHILSDESGNLWMATREGIAFFPRMELDAYAEQRGTTVHATLFSTIDGLLTQECGPVGPQPSACRARDGRLFFASRKGLVIVDPKHLPQNSVPPSVHIEERIADDNSFDETGNMVLEAGTERVEIHYTALSLRVPSRVRFRYRLIGYDSGWVEAGSRRTAFYAKLPPGSYRFQVVACNDDGLWNEVGDTLEVIQKPHVYQMIGFQVLGLLGLAAGTLALIQWRTRHLRQARIVLESTVAQRTEELRKEAQERLQAEQALRDSLVHQEVTRRVLGSQEDERKRIAAELHDGLGQNLLIIKNHLSMACRSPLESEALIRDSRDLVSQSLQEVREISHHLRPHQLDELGLSGGLEAMLRRLAVGSELKIRSHVENVDALLSPEAATNLYRIAQEALNNAIKHADASHIFLSLEHKDRELELCITDDGHGFDTKQPGSSGAGLMILSERAELLGAELKLQSQPEHGTTFLLRIPLPETQP